MKKPDFIVLLPVIFLSSILSSCKSKDPGPSAEQISQLNLKRGEVISCGVPDKQFGSVVFETSCGEKIKKDFNLAVELLHSFEYDEAEKVFAKIIDADPGCAMAYWGVAMSNYHPLWAPPTEVELRKGADAVSIAQSITKKSKREAAYIDAIAAFYKNWDSVDHHTRSVRFEKAMEKLYSRFANDKEAAIFYALALDASADPADKSYRNQKKAGGILFALYPGEPDHPGIAHYIIHTYDYPGLAPLALEIARKYASIAPSSAHAQHMPSHIFTRLGLWDECITANLASIASARCYAESAGLKGHWDEELHGLDYLVYAYLQKGENDLARKQWEYLQTIHDVYPVNFKVAYAFAAIPSRYVLENRNWNEAAALKISPERFPWARFPWQEAIFHFAKLLGFVHLGNMESANNELMKLNTFRDTLVKQKDAFKANQVQIQITTSDAWIHFKEGKYREAAVLMNMAADMEDKTEKHPVTPCEVIPARELLGDMFLQMNKPDLALTAYETDLETHPNRLNGLFGAGVAAGKSHHPEKAALYYKQLAGNLNPDDTDNPMLIKLKSYLAMASSK